MKSIDVLRKYYGIACHNLFCYSANYGMTRPKEGFEDEFLNSKEEADLLRSMIEEEEKKEDQRKNVGQNNLHIELMRYVEEENKLNLERITSKI